MYRTHISALDLKQKDIAWQTPVYLCGFEMELEYSLFEKKNGIWTWIFFNGL